MYERLLEVDRQIHEAVALDNAALRARLAIADQGAPDYVKEETVVYLLRRAYAADDGMLVDDLTTTLLGRCTTLLRHHLGPLGADAVEEGSVEFAADLVAQILEGNRGDFLQVRFWVATPKSPSGCSGVLCVPANTRATQFRSRRSPATSRTRVAPSLRGSWMTSQRHRTRKW